MEAVNQQEREAGPPAKFAHQLGNSWATATRPHVIQICARTEEQIATGHKSSGSSAKS